MNGTIRRIDLCSDANPFDADLSPFSVLASLPADAAHPPSLPQTNKMGAPSSNRGVELLKRIRQVGSQPQESSVTAHGVSKPMPTSSNTSAPSLKQLPESESRVPKRTAFKLSRTDVSSSPPGSQAAPKVKSKEQLLAALRDVNDTDTRACIALTILNSAGESTFTRGTGLGDLDMLRDKGAPHAGALLASFDGSPYSLGVGAAGLSALHEMLQDADLAPCVEFCGFGLTTLYQLLIGIAAGAPLDGRRFTDVRIMAWMLRPDQPLTSFDDMVSLHRTLIPNAAPTSLDPQSLEGICARLAMLPHVVRGFTRALANKGMLAAFNAVEKPLGAILARMKYVGFPVDTREIEGLSSETVSKMDELKARAGALLPGHVTFNIQSPEQCRRILFDDLQLASLIPATELANVTTTTGRLSTSEEVLRLLSAHHPLPGLILEYRKIAKLQQTYFDGVFSHATSDPSTSIERVSRIHATFLQDGTDTGRISCSEPNLQNLPRCTDDLLGSVRRAFVAPPGELLLAVDYEQIELRVLAHISSDPALQASLTSSSKADSDIHRRIASRIFNKPLTSVTTQERTAAKRVVFGVIYGMGPRTLASQLGISFDEARRIVQEFKSSFPTIERLIDDTLRVCRENGYVRTLLNRVRYLPDINCAVSSQRRAAAERQAFNTVIQGSAADLVKKAMVDVHHLIESNKLKARMICQIHDELIFTIPVEAVRDEVPLLQRCMESCMLLAVPLVVKASVGPSLGSLQESVTESP